ncbi:carbon monoxide dehydrogenase subunit G [Planomicrobium stackebrandtii]|uniref:Carbon monoxide dehydrogenase subunit G n=1 Tax=Planomicrobium stackebrandtii TaxID=253160 RepID=A0ABU0GRS2_9BACL|nr:SRPBCC family protein [Planomicrobium stackebrandtii]MDQ0427315.1 carbon monoxide dehydrogenase subunit G [Planomicrobium stackebrandtii]
MVKWKEEMTIDASIENVWSLFQDENIQKLMPKVEEHILLENSPDQLGAKHAQSYHEGNQLQTYIVETVGYEDLPEKKLKQTQFDMGQSFQVFYSFTLLKEGENKTRFIYEGTNKGKGLMGKAMLLSGSKKTRQQTVTAFMERVRDEALKL